MQKRLCLSCDLEFRSEGIHNRLCRTCGERAKRHSGPMIDEIKLNTGMKNRKQPVQSQASDWKVIVKQNVGA